MVIRRTSANGSVAVRQRRNPSFIGRDLRAYGEFAAVFHCVHRVEEEIEKHLLELVSIGPNCINICLPRTS